MRRAKQGNVNDSALIQAVNMQDVFAKYLVLTVEIALFTTTKVFMVYSDNINTGPGILPFFFLL